MRSFVHLLLIVLLMLPPLAMAAEKDPLSYSIGQYGFTLGLSVIAGFCSWYAKVRRGELQAASLTALVGELTTSALAGLLTFFVCEWLNFPPLLTAAIVGVAGHMGTRAISWAEDALKRRADAAIGGTTSTTQEKQQ